MYFRKYLPRKTWFNKCLKIHVSEDPYKDEIFEELKKENAILMEHLKDVEQRLDRQGQYSRRNCLIIYGIKEGKE